MTSAKLDQIDLVLAIMQEVARQYPNLTVLPRQSNAIIDAANDIVREFSRGEIMAAPGIGIEAWRKTDQCGASSDFMAAKLGNYGIRDYSHPRDPSDFGRCLSLLEAAPELREKLPEMAAESPQWAALVANWEELEALWNEEAPTGQAPKLYKRMQELLKEREHG